MSRNVLVLCTGNSCRSQMAQVLWQNLANGDWQAFSAGSKPSGYVHPLALVALSELSLDTSGLSSKPISAIDLATIDLVVTVCDNAEKDCPILPKNIDTLHWPFDDPADAQGTDEDKMFVFRRVRDEIRTAIKNFLGVQNA